MRFNVDPTEQCTDEEIRKVLEDAEIDKLVLKKKDEDEKKKKENAEKFKEHEARLKSAGHGDLEGKFNKKEFSVLDFHVESGGSNLSSGEKALICICRAILRKSKVVILDEATATIDLKTEQAIQKIIGSAFKDATMIVIAHRLQTIINSDKVLVMAAGKKKEFGAPQKLLKNPLSNFSKLVNRMKAEEDEAAIKKQKEEEEKEKSEKKDKKKEQKEE